MVTVCTDPQEAGSHGLNRTVVRSRRARLAVCRRVCEHAAWPYDGWLWAALLNEPQSTRLWSMHGNSRDKNAEDAARRREQSPRHSARQHCAPSPAAPSALSPRPGVQQMPRATRAFNVVLHEASPSNPPASRYVREVSHSSHVSSGCHPCATH